MGTRSATGGGAGGGATAWLRRPCTGGGGGAGAGSGGSCNTRWFSSRRIQAVLCSKLGPGMTGGATGAVAHADAPSAKRSANDVRVTSAMISSGRVQFRYIAVEGPIGAGKTTLSERLSTRLDATLVLEETENPYLTDFYADRPGAALQAQLFYLLNRHRQQTILRQADLFSQITISDYLFDKDKIFAYLNLDDNELFIYQRLFDLLARDVPPPDLVVYLQAPTELLMERLRNRERDPEIELPLPAEEYVRELNEAYQHFFFHYTSTPLLVVETAEFDPESDDAALEELVKQIKGMGKGTRYYVARK
jgi:deoxyguanosine kinase